MAYVWWYNYMMTKVVLQKIISCCSPQLLEERSKCFRVCGWAKCFVVGMMCMFSEAQTFLWAIGTCPYTFFSGSLPSNIHQSCSDLYNTCGDFLIVSSALTVRSRRQMDLKLAACYRNKYTLIMLSQWAS